MGNFKQNNINFTIEDNFTYGETKRKIKGKISSNINDYLGYTNNDNSFLINGVDIDWNKGEVNDIIKTNTNIEYIKSTGDFFKVLNNLQNHIYDLKKNVKKIIDDLTQDDKYLTFIPLEDCKFILNAYQPAEGETINNIYNSIQYSIDDGNSWVTLHTGVESPEVKANNKILWRSENIYDNSLEIDYNGNYPRPIPIGTFSSTKKFNIQGNITSIIYGYTFDKCKKNDLGSPYSFEGLFKNSKVVKANRLAITFDSLHYDNYFKEMFLDCKELISEPVLNCESLSTGCYNGIFKGCIKLDNAYELPLRNLKPYCYANMFSGCTSLTSAPALPAIIMEDHCYENMFSGCTSLTSAPTLPASTLANYCYSGMFSGCTSLTSAPVLSNPILSDGCYANMFSRCTSLTSAPILLAIDLFPYCYDSMFKGCINIERAPELPATQLVEKCYNEMFNGCSSLNYINAQFVTIPNSLYTNNWVKNVANQGTFVQNDYAEWNEHANYAIPMNWNVTKNTLNYGETYFTLMAVNNNISFKFTNSINYSLDYGVTWTSLAANTNTPALAINDMIMFKGTLTPSSNNGIGTFSSTGNFNAFGNIMSLLYGDNFKNQNSLSGKNYVFKNLFKNSYIADASNLILPATTLSEGCYSNMFSNCTILKTNPTLPATVLSSYCYANMFSGCTSLTSAPALPATTLANYCYSDMFNGCANLLYAPNLSALIAKPYCYANMFKGCVNLETIPRIYATTLADHCYFGLFEGCTRLLISVEFQLSATTLASYCYGNMFKGCIRISTAPALPATTLVEGCYSGMFNGCTNIEIAPELPATTLVSNCYNEMFNGCSSLNYINAAFITTPGTSYTNNWVNGVAASGTFVKNILSTWDVIGVHGIPINWLIDNLNDNMSNKYLMLTALENGTTFAFTNPISYSLDYGTTWTSLAANTNTPQLNNNDIIMFKGTLTPTSSNGIGTFSSNKSFNASGNAMSLLYGDNFKNKTSLSGKNYAFYKLFRDSKVVNVSNLILPATTLADYCYCSMFKGCTGLTFAPALPATSLAPNCYKFMFGDCTSLPSSPLLQATTLAEGCYEYMFTGCTSLTSAPALPVTSLAPYCYGDMFSGCTSLTSAPELPATTLARECYISMFKGCTNLTSAPALPATTLVTYCYHSIFSGCTSLTSAPELPATTLAEGCYYDMFWGCTSITTAPALPATTLAQYCYIDMFNECTSLTTAPVLPATTLVNRCYDGMFDGCSSLNYIKALFTTTPGTSYTKNWVNGVAASGTFVKNDNASWDVRGVNGVPENWNFIDNTIRITTSGNTLTANMPVNWASLNSEITCYPSTGISTTLSINGLTKIGTLTIVPKNTEILEGRGIYCDIIWEGMLATQEATIFANKDGFTSVSNTYTVTEKVALPTGNFNLIIKKNNTQVGSISITNPNTSPINYEFKNILIPASILTCDKNSSNESINTTYNLSISGISGENITISSSNVTIVSYNNYQLMLTALENGTTFAFTNPTSYSLDYGSTWTSLAANTNTPTLNANTDVLFKGTLTPAVSNGIGKFSSNDKTFNVSGNVMSLLYGDNFRNQTSLSGKNYAFYKLLNNSKVVDASNLILPATTLSNYCYFYMFANCTSLTSAPALHATTLTNYCYDNMFRGCTSLTSAPALPATTLAEACYSEMFFGCTSLTTAPTLPATTLAKSCYDSMFGGCTSLTSAPVLSATTLASNCYDSMFVNCTNLTLAPALLVTTLADSCYARMFNGCANLTTAPVLPATTLADYCYESMFANCTSLTSAPALPATTLTEDCYSGMFAYCTSLTSAPALQATTLANYCYSGMFIGCTSLSTAPTLHATSLAYECYSNMFYNCTSLISAPALPAITLAERCYAEMFKGCTSLTSAPELPAPILTTGCYDSMFYGCSSLNYIKALFTTKPGTSYTFNWVKGVAALGTFIKNAAWNVRGVNGVPSGWNTQEYVEIGGIKWATKNVGANSITDTGLYFQWGDTQGYTASQVGSGTGQKYFDWPDYKYANGTSDPGAAGMTKYNASDGKTVLDASDDAVIANWGGQWRMPTYDEYIAFGNAVTTTWTADYQGSSVAGLVCTDKTDSSKVLFFPLCGRCLEGRIDDYLLHIWSNSLCNDGAQYGNSVFGFYNSDEIRWQTGVWRCCGHTVRGVLD